MADATSPQTVLVIDDDDSVRRVATLRLQREGFRALSVSNGKDGLALAMTEHPSAILPDLLMPVVDGLEVFRRLRADATTRRIPASSSPSWGKTKCRCPTGPVRCCLSPNRTIPTS